MKNNTVVLIIHHENRLVAMIFQFNIPKKYIFNQVKYNWLALWYDYKKTLEIIKNEILTPIILQILKMYLKIRFTIINLQQIYVVLFHKASAPTAAVSVQQRPLELSIVSPQLKMIQCCHIFPYLLRILTLPTILYNYYICLRMLKFI